MKISIGADHAGFELKEHVKGLLTEQGHEVVAGLLLESLQQAQVVVRIALRIDHHFVHTPQVEPLRCEIVHQRVEKLTDGDAAASVTTLNHWVDEGSHKTLLAEYRRTSSRQGALDHRPWETRGQMLTEGQGAHT